MDVLVVGAGYLGLGIAKYFLDLGNNVSLFGRKKIDVTWIHKLNFICGDIRDEKTISKLSKLDATFVIYTISLSQSDTEKDPNNALDTNVRPVWLFLDELAHKECVFIYLSTVQVYGKLVASVDGNQIPEPINHYGLTHLLAEQISLRYRNKNLLTFNLRISNSYGPPETNDSNCWSLVVNDFCRSAYTEGKIEIKSDGSSLRNFIHRQDVFSAIRVVAENSSSLRSTTLNLAGTETLSVLDLAILVAKIYQNKFRCRIDIYVQGSKLQNFSHKNIINSDKFTIDISPLRDLGHVSRFDLNSGISKFFDFLKEEAH